MIDPTLAMPLNPCSTAVLMVKVEPETEAPVIPIPMPVCSNSENTASFEILSEGSLLSTCPTRSRNA